MTEANKPSIAQWIINTQPVACKIEDCVFFATTEEYNAWLETEEGKAWEEKSRSLLPPEG